MLIEELLSILDEQRISNTGRLGELERALNLWGEGKMAEAEPLLLALADVAAPFAHVEAPMLYRGFMPSASQLERLSHGFDISAHPERVLASWSTDTDSVEEFMFGWEQSWVILSKPTEELDVFINLVEFEQKAKPFTRFGSQNEVIVRMPPKMWIAQKDIYGPIRYS